ncbi:hypothetical protein TEA_006354 [Camellia sinensis var. sinensis]|uniref:Protein kinase domain-containing protein n=1 Tax=Camellia sinensis var. sinensis TaxID=542762 RepID=A0A4S4DNA6_CAMSN|nr:hypothetical protein TEA_006354 [Camellia sinensis var. sinensis]
MAEVVGTLDLALLSQHKGRSKGITEKVLQGIATVPKATNDFSEDRLIGEGQLCKVYKGFSDGETDIVAIKRFKKLKSLQHWKEARVEIEKLHTSSPNEGEESLHCWFKSSCKRQTMDQVIDPYLIGTMAPVCFKGDAIVQCNGSIAVCNVDLEMVMESAVSRRFMETKKYISPGALKRDQPVCNGGGTGEAYNKTGGCLPPQSNPYDRGYDGKGIQYGSLPEKHSSRDMDIMTT